MEDPLSAITIVPGLSVHDVETAPAEAKPAAADIPAVDADIDPGVIAAQLPQILVMHDPAAATRCGRAPASRRAAIGISAGVRTLTMTAWARAALDDHRLRGSPQGYPKMAPRSAGLRTPSVAACILAALDLVRSPSR
jgi:hypothetical protein